MKKSIYTANDRKIPLPVKYLISVALTTAVALLLLLVGCFIAYKSEDPVSVSRITALTGLCITFLLGGIMAPIITKNGKISSLITGAALVLLLFAVSLFFENENAVYIKLLLYLSGVGISFAGGLLTGIHKRKSSAMARYKKLRR